MKRARVFPQLSVRLILSASMLATWMTFADSSPSEAGVSCQDFGCVKVELTYDGARRMRYFVQAYNFPWEHHRQWRYLRFNQSALYRYTGEDLPEHDRMRERWSFQLSQPV